VSVYNSLLVKFFWFWWCSSERGNVVRVLCSM